MDRLHKTLNRLLLFSALCCLTIALSGCAKEDKLPNAFKHYASHKGRRTVVIYQAAQNSLGAKDYNYKDFRELIAGTQYLNDDDRLLLFVDDMSAPRIYFFSKEYDEPQIVRQWKKDVNSADPKTLQDVLRWAKEKCPADEYGLVLWSHADGWLPATNKDYRQQSFGIDVGPSGNPYTDSDASGRSGSQADIPDLATAIQQSGVHLRFILFDACLMQSLEVAYDLRHVTDYLIGSPIAIHAAGANYTHQLQNGLFAADPKQIAVTYYNDVVDPNQQDTYGDFGIVLSVIDTKHMESLAAAIKNALPRSAFRAAPRFSPDMTDVTPYHYYSSSNFYRPHYYDALDALHHLLSPADYAAVRLQMQKAIPFTFYSPRFWIGPSSVDFQELNSPTLCGTSMFIPQQIYSDNAYLAKQHGDLNAAFRKTEWYKAAGWAQTGW